MPLEIVKQQPAEIFEWGRVAGIETTLRNACAIVGELSLLPEKKLVLARSWDGEPTVTMDQGGNLALRSTRLVGEELEDSWSVYELRDIYKPLEGEDAVNRQHLVRFRNKATFNGQAWVCTAPRAKPEGRILGGPIGVCGDLLAAHYQDPRFFAHLNGELLNRDFRKECVRVDRPRVTELHTALKTIAGKITTSRQPKEDCFLIDNVGSIAISVHQNGNLHVWIGKGPHKYLSYRLMDVDDPAKGALWRINLNEKHLEDYTSLIPDDRECFVLVGTGDEFHQEGDLLFNIFWQLPLLTQTAASLQEAFEASR